MREAGAPSPGGGDVSAKFCLRGPEVGRAQSPNQGGLHLSPVNSDHRSARCGQPFNMRIKTQKASFMRDQTKKSVFCFMLVNAFVEMARLSRRSFVRMSVSMLLSF